MAESAVKRAKISLLGNLRGHVYRRRANFPQILHHLRAFYHRILPRVPRVIRRTGEREPCKKVGMMKKVPNVSDFHTCALKDIIIREHNDITTSQRYHLGIALVSP